MITLVHLVYDKGGKQVTPCLGDQTTEYRIHGAVLTHPGYQLTGDPRAVTCPACKQTPIFTELKKRYGNA